MASEGHQQQARRRLWEKRKEGNDMTMIDLG